MNGMLPMIEMSPYQQDCTSTRSMQGSSGKQENGSCKIDLIFYAM